MNKFKDMKISRRMSLAFITLIVLFIINAAASSVCMRHVSDRFSRFYDDQFQVVEAADKFLINFQGFGKSISRMALASIEDLNTDTVSAVERQQNTAEVFYQGMMENLEILEQCESMNQNDFQVMQSQVTEIYSIYEKMTQSFKAGKTKEGISTFDNEYFKLGSELLEYGNAIVAEAEAAAQQAHLESSSMVMRLFVFSVILAVVLLATAVFLCIRLTNSIVRPMKELQEAARSMANGNLHFDLAYESKNEMGELAEDFKATSQSLELYIHEIDKEMQAIGAGDLSYESEVEFLGDFCAIQDSMKRIRQALVEIMKQINSSADQVANGARQIAENGQELSQATLEQASSVEELAATINDVSERVQYNAENAIESSRMADRAAAEVMEAGDKVKMLSLSMAEMKKLSGEITQIMKDIEDIAFQTNILSLNAAVEAARAGEAGRGFSVVANEIRQLAAKTTDASKSTGTLINRTISMMGEGSTLAEKTADEFTDMSKVVKGSAEIVEKIAKASNEQANAIVQIRQSIELINEIVQQNSASAEESAASSEELTGQMQMLKKLVGIFKY